MRQMKIGSVLVEDYLITIQVPRVRGDVLYGRELGPMETILQYG